MSEDELETLREDFVKGAYSIKISEEQFDMAAYNRHLLDV